MFRGGAATLETVPERPTGGPGSSVRPGLPSLPTRACLRGRAGPHSSSRSPSWRAPLTAKSR
jgi:hypothetical protein